MELTAPKTAAALAEDVEQLKKDVTKLTTDAKAHAHAQVDDARQRFNEAVARMQEQLTAHPFAILGFGLLLGFVFGRRSNHRRLRED